MDFSGAKIETLSPGLGSTTIGPTSLTVLKAAVSFFFLYTCFIYLFIYLLPHPTPEEEAILNVAVGHQTFVFITREDSLFG